MICINCGETYYWPSCMTCRARSMTTSELVRAIARDETSKHELYNHDREDFEYGASECAVELDRRLPKPENVP